jgi:hypothetical protein
MVAGERPKVDTRVTWNLATTPGVRRTTYRLYGIRGSPWRLVR